LRKIILFLVFAFILVSCDASQSGSSGSGSFLPSFGSSSKKTPEVNVYVGTSGLTAEFAKTAPPPKVFEQSSFPILLRIRNIGAYSLNYPSSPLGILSIGRERDYIPQLIIEENNKITLRANDNELAFGVDGKTQLNPQGDELIISINARTGKLDPQSENKQSTLTATLCYPYKTTLSTTICIDPDVAGVRPGKKACTVKELAFNGGQGAPIAIVKIEPQMIPEVGQSPGSKADVIKPQFLIFVENKGKGTPVDNRFYSESCSRRDAADVAYPWNVAYIRAYTTSETKEAKENFGNQLICCPNKDGQCPETATGDTAGFLRFKDKKDYIRCTFKKGILRNSDAYTSPLRIEIDYGYVQTISTSFFIQKPLKY